MIINRDCSVEGSLPVFPLDSASHRVTPHHDAGSRKVPLVGIAFAGISGFRVTPGHPAPDAGSREGPQRASAFADISRPGISGFRIKCGMTRRRGPVRESPRTTMRGPERGRKREWACRYSWIPHQVRNDREGISGFRVVARYDVEHRITARYDEVTGSSVWVTPHHDAGSREERRGIHLPVFLDSASSAE